jgi:hypothetical protein
MNPETEERIASQLTTLNELVKHLATKEDLLLIKTDFHKELHAQSWRVFILMIAQTSLILGAVYFMLGDIKNDLRDLRNRVAALPAKP